MSTKRGTIFISGEAQGEFPSWAFTWDGRFWIYLRKGHHLKIFNKHDPSKIVWEGVIDLLPPELDPGFMRQRGWESGNNWILWVMWFMERFPAELTD